MNRCQIIALAVLTVFYAVYFGKMLTYAQMQMDPENPVFALTHQSLRTIGDSSSRYEAMGIRMDEIGMAWAIDTEHGFIWHNGETDDYNR